MSESTTSPSAEETPASARGTETHGHEETRHKEKRIAFDVTYDGSIFEVKFSPSKKIRAAFASLAEALSLEQDEVHIPEDNAEKTIKEIGDNTIEAKYKDKSITIKRQNESSTSGTKNTADKQDSEQNSTTKENGASVNPSEKQDTLVQEDITSQKTETENNLDTTTTATTTTTTTTATSEKRKSKKEKKKSKKIDTNAEAGQSNSIQIVLAPVEKPVVFATRREAVINEIITTENAYCNDLAIILDVYLHPLQTRRLLTAEEEKTLFPQLDAIAKIHNNLLTTLKNLPEGKKGIGDVFTNISHFMLSYSAYCASEEARAEWLRKKRKKAPFEAFLIETYKNPILKNLRIEDFLIKPIQRICKYPLLLRELLAETPETHEDYNSIKKAFDGVSSIVATVNAKKREQEVNTRLRNLLVGVTLPPSLPSGVSRTLLEDKALVEFEKVTGCCTETYYVLCNDALIRLGRKNGKSTLKSADPLVLVRVAQVEDTSELVNLGLSATYLCYTVITSKTEYLLISKTFEEKLDLSAFVEKMTASIIDKIEKIINSPSKDEMFLLGQIGSLAEQQEFKKPDIVGDPAVLQTQSPNGIKIDRSSVSLSNATENTSVEEAEAEKTQSDVGNGLTLLKADLDAVMKKYHLKRKTKVPPVPAIDDLILIRCSYYDTRYIKADPSSFEDFKLKVSKKFGVPQDSIQLSLNDSQVVPITSQKDFEEAINNDILDFIISVTGTD